MTETKVGNNINDYTITLVEQSTTTELVSGDVQTHTRTLKV